MDLGPPSPDFSLRSKSTSPLRGEVKKGTAVPQRHLSPPGRGLHRRRPVRGNYLSAIILAGVMALAATAASAQPAADWDAVIAAAKREGQVVVYSTYMSPKTHQAVGDAFEKKYGIRVELLQGRGEIRERVRIEQASGRYLGDVLHTAITVAVRARDENHSLQQLGPMPGLARLKPEFKRRTDDYMAPIFTINYGILVNTRLVKPGKSRKAGRTCSTPNGRARFWPTIRAPRAAAVSCFT
jgi:hypothetical protein